jgi:hypothetical protein
LLNPFDGEVQGKPFNLDDCLGELHRHQAARDHEAGMRVNFAALRSGIGGEAGHRIVDDCLVVDRTRTHGRRNLAPGMA